MDAREKDQLMVFGKQLGTQFGKQFGRHLAGFSVVAALVTGAGFELRGQSAPTAQQATTQQGATAATGPQGIPDAPKPQTLPQLNTITPVGAALPSAPTATPDAPGTTLPLTPTITADPGPDVEQGPPPDEHMTAKITGTGVTFVQVPFTVKDSKGKLVAGLTWRDVRIYENNQRQPMKVFTVDPFPLSVALVIDQSVTFDVMKTINNSLGALQGAFAAYDEVAVFTYNSSVHEQTDFLAAQSARLGVMIDRSKGKGREPTQMLGGPLSDGLVVNNEPVSPLTNGSANNSGVTLSNNNNPEKEFHPLNDAIFAAAQSLAHAAKGRRRIVYVISDGKEYGSTAKEKEVIKYCQTNKIAIYATLVGDSSLPGVGFLDRIHIPLTMRDNALPRFTGATGGEFDAEFRQKGIETSFATIAKEVRTQYTIGYTTKLSPLSETFRTLRVDVLQPNLEVIAPKGYYPSASDSRPAPATPTPMATP